MNFKTGLPRVVKPEAVLHCPNCNHAIKLTESLAAPLIEENRRVFQEQLVAKDAEMARRTDALRQERDQLARDRDGMEGEIARRIGEERGRIISQESRKARESVAAEIASKDAEAVELRNAIEANNAKLAEAQKTQAELLRKHRELDEERRELDLTVERRVEASLQAIRLKAQQEADASARLRVIERDQTIESMGRTIEELKRKAELSSQQGLGEAFELELEDVLRSRFPADLVEAVGKGEIGADVVQKVNGNVGRNAGTILWETKRTKAWSDAWLAKLRDDQRRCGADMAIIVSHALPKKVDHFDLVEGVWVSHPRYAVVLAIALRQTIVEVEESKIAQQGQLAKTELVYRYLTGTKFRQRVEAVVEKFNDMRDDLEKERKFMGRQWAKREMQIVTVVDSTVGLVGDLQAIAGKAVPEIASLETVLIEAGDQEKTSS
ncbi:DUF2130 domain-containing protein [Bradyrhizobium sp. CCBAU 53338]|uniref:DUF2130 domain-containing protein n=1 Tax=Bradyrhizobium sp. CCBAU 53338 TaxID=1325111 RepID=UPI001FEFF7B4|nr:DUF2130 domain-containing protein [Bradyrhizobium sp. CCBAU 53338]